VSQVEQTFDEDYYMTPSVKTRVSFNIHKPSNPIRFSSKDEE